MVPNWQILTLLMFPVPPQVFLPVVRRHRFPATATGSMKPFASPTPILRMPPAASFALAVPFQLHRTQSSALGEEPQSIRAYLACGAWMLPYRPMTRLFQNLEWLPSFRSKNRLPRRWSTRALRLARLDRSADAIAVYDEVIARFGATTELLLRQQVAKAMFNKALVSARLTAARMQSRSMMR